MTAWFRRRPRPASPELDAVAALERMNQRLIDALVAVASRSGPAATAALESLGAPEPTVDPDGADELNEAVPDQVRQAIHQMADPDAEEWDELESFARRRMAEGCTPSDIAHEILEGQDPFVYLE